MLRDNKDPAFIYSENNSERGALYCMLPTYNHVFLNLVGQKIEAFYVEN
jgi:hypothetical protein